MQRGCICIIEIGKASTYATLSIPESGNEKYRPTTPCQTCNKNENLVYRMKAINRKHAPIAGIKMVG